MPPIIRDKEKDKKEGEGDKEEEEEEEERGGEEREDLLELWCIYISISVLPSLRRYSIVALLVGYNPSYN